MLALVVLGLVVGVLVQLKRPLPPPMFRLDATRSVGVTGTTPVPPWPAQGQSAVAVPELGVLRESGPEVPVPVASVTKMMTAYVVLRAHPLGPDDQGPSLSLTAADQNEADADADAGDAAVPVQTGEQVTERQLLDGLMVPSADNLADVLAMWVSGSTAAFVATMNATAARLGMRDTHYADPAGLDATTVSTAADSLRLAATAMKLPAFAAIVDQHTATLPVAGLVTNPDRSIGIDGFVGIKSGFTDAAQGCLVLATLRQVDGRHELVLAAAMGQGGLDPLGAADTVTRALIDSAAAGLEPYSLLEAGAVMGTERSRWGASTAVRTVATIRAVVEPGDVVHIAVVRSTWRGIRSGTVVVSEGGHVVLTQRLRTGPMSPPSWWWRLLHG
ncbi:MAG TPA: hypothetical protein VED63_08760 [Acidimicrobiales bacterium]|nr:hypothetical protein [Acidimicrobiales bacterium]